MTSNASLSDELMGQLQGAPMQGLAQQLGIDSVQAEQAVGVALPMLFGALGQNAAQPQGAADLLGALQRDHSSANGAMDLGSLVGGLLGARAAVPVVWAASWGPCWAVAPVAGRPMAAPFWAISLAVSVSRPSRSWARPRAWVPMRAS